jgi:hypothetical protein
MSTSPADRDQAARAEILAKLAQSREELRQILDPPPERPGGTPNPAGSRPDGFPRSRTMQLLMSGRGLGTLGAAAAGLLLARPAWALRLLRLLPAGTFARVLVARLLSALHDKKSSR